MTAEHRIKLFRHGATQAAEIPREFELPGEDAIIRREGAKLVIEASEPRSLLAVLASLSPLKMDFAPAPDQPPEPVVL